MARDEWGDFQTPFDLTQQIIEIFRHQNWKRILEPTCGVGNFLKSSTILGDHIQRQGIEVNSAYVAKARSAGFDVRQGNIFHMKLNTELIWQQKGSLLVIGNPPWITNSQLGMLGSMNLPTKSNIKGFDGFSAITGSSNFDIAEFIFLKLMIELEHEKPTIALLVKTQVARNILLYAEQSNLHYSGYEIRLIDAKKHFNVSVDACLFVAQYDENPKYECDVYPDIISEKPIKQMISINGKLISDTAKYKLAKQIDGVSPLEWRSGIKHDAAKVMEVNLDTVRRYELEDKYVYPLLKCSDIFCGRLQPNKYVIVTQQKLGEDTRHLKYDAPKLWIYLMENSKILDGRKSKLYNKQPRFSMFGIGDYAFAPFKIAVSGLHKSARFALLGSFEGYPVLVDDASYILSFDDSHNAALCYALLSSKIVSDMLQAIVFTDSKRPITKKVLQRIDLRSVVESSSFRDIIPFANHSLYSIGEQLSRPWETVISSLMMEWDAKPTLNFANS
ncbi:SAM-dependent methyltransferase [Candidatus Poriferisocius sp.]|uniref:SAM-dependent methyltransferase n=1 Tax=Candidatus Poriferisocius sp. TaxID=3101276 RepID=UPI003B02E01F